MYKDYDVVYRSGVANMNKFADHMNKYNGTKSQNVYKYILYFDTFL